MSRLSAMEVLNDSLPAKVHSESNLGSIIESPSKGRLPTLLYLHLTLIRIITLQLLRQNRLQTPIPIHLIQTAHKRLLILNIQILLPQIQRTHRHSTRPQIRIMVARP